MNIGLFFGSFDPIHRGHVFIAKHKQIAQKTDQVWFVITPQSPFKNGKISASFSHREKMARMALSDHPDLYVSNIEINMPSPQYTTNTLKYLKVKHPTYRFSIIMGFDNFVSLVDMKWKDSNYILNNFKIFVYNRHIEDETISFSNYIIKSYKKFKPNITALSGTRLPTSSTSVRLYLNQKYPRSSINSPSLFIKKNLDIRVLNYILKNKLYY
ncbi:MAG: nicotinate (nicotinamide) nucleotide adenylyltransferase [Flavobacteriales bacterium]|nr:nicotinate (nicotinamide) nucleotide adenylyltransferase [Flavobacteriales bacterium]